jgi:hypothetical protein
LLEKKTPKKNLISSKNERKVFKKIFFLIIISVLLLSTLQTNEMALNKITLGGGCFWCIESAFRRLRGVQSAVSGYAGGHTENPTYKEVTLFL